jgi:pimeloyl-ACP methyl ester carboxylesterase
MNGYVEALRPDYQLILVDARGHGASDKPHEPAAYALSLRVSDIVAVLDALHLSTAHFWGYSMGAVDWVWHGEVCTRTSPRPDHRRHRSV